jgi:predicted chitinase
MTPPRSVLENWRALEAADRVRAEFDRRIGDLEVLSEAVRAECHRLDGDGWRGAAFEAVLATVEASHRHIRMLCDQAEGLRDAGVRALSDLHYTALALLDYVADAEADGCTVGQDWSVTAESAAGAEWAEVIGEALAAVERAEQRGRQAILAVGRELRHLAGAFGGDLGPGGPRSPSPDSADPTGHDVPERTSDASRPAALNSRPGYAISNGTGADSSMWPAVGADAASNSEPAEGDEPSATEGASAVGGGSAEPAMELVAAQLFPLSMTDVGPMPGPGVSAEQLVAIMPDLPMDQAREYLPALNAAMQEGGITTPQRQAAFLAQLAHESCQLRYFQELGDDDYFHQYDPGQPDAAAGNTEPGDGPRYHGRGPIQLTGRANYRAAGQALGLNLEGDPEIAARPDVGFRIAQWYWASRDINALADAGDFAAVTRAINGGYNGMESREAFYQRALEVLG